MKNKKEDMRMKYQCMNCFREFEEPIIHKINSKFTFKRCPSCRSLNFVEKEGLSKAGVEQ